MSKEFKFKKTEQVVSYATILVADNTNEDEARERVKNNGEWVEFSRTTDGDIHYVGMQKKVDALAEATAEAAVDGNAPVESDAPNAPPQQETEAESHVSEASASAPSDEQAQASPNTPPLENEETQA